MKSTTLRRAAGIAVAVTAAATGLVVTAGPADAAGVLAAPFDADYTITDLGTPPGVPGPLGGLTLKAGDPDTLLIGGLANGGGGGIYEIGITRDANGHISSWDGTATRVADAPNIDGGLVYAPNGVLMYTAYPINVLGQIKTGSTAPDKLIDLTAEGISSSTGTLQFVPTGVPGAGSLKIASYNAGTFYDVDLTDAGDGTYDVAGTTLESTPLGGPEGIAYVAPGSPDFPNPSLLLSEYGNGAVGAYELDSNGAPVVASRRNFITGLGGAEGAHIDAQTNDFLFSTFSGANTVIVVSGFGAPTCQHMFSSAGVTYSYDSGSGVTTITGTEGDDIIAGTSGVDEISGGGGDDLICGRKGNDVIDAGEGDDKAYGQTGNDEVNGEGGKDRVYGNIGDDTLTGGNGADKMWGGQGTDSCDGGINNDKANTCETVTTVP
jgi:Ca2+-binding RTX toxin-like protein